MVKLGKSKHSSSRSSSARRGSSRTDVHVRTVKSASTEEKNDDMLMGRTKPQCVKNRELLLKEIQDNENLERMRQYLDEFGVFKKMGVSRNSPIGFEALKILVRHWKLGSNKDKHFWRHNTTKWDLVDVLLKHITEKETSAQRQQMHVDKCNAHKHRSRVQRPLHFYQDCKATIQQGRQYPDDNLFLQHPDLDMNPSPPKPKKVPQLYLGGGARTHRSSREETDTDSFIRGMISQSRNVMDGVRLPQLNTRSEIVTKYPSYLTDYQQPNTARF